MPNLTQDSKLFSDLNQINRINTDTGVVLLNKLKNYHSHFNRVGKTNLQKTIVKQIISSEIPSSFEFTKDEYGAPLIRSNEYTELSISHSNGYFALYLSRGKPIGIDIESTREIAGPGTSYFLNSSENKQWTNSELLSIWGAKESYFKKMKGRVDDLRSEATTLRISNNFVDLICNGKNHSFCVDQNEKYTLVYG